jgi:hypothetical protein
MPNIAQLQKIWLLSDTVLYPEAVSFIHKLVEEQECNPLPSSQVSGLLSIAESTKYDELYRFVLHQRDRDWPPSRRDIKTFYTALEEVLSLMRRKRLKDEFHLVADAQGQSVHEMRQESDALMALLAREFIQHLMAENGLLAVAIADQRAKQRANERARQKPNRR